MNLRLLHSGLPPAQRFLLALRLGSSILAIIFILLELLLPFGSKRVYISRIDCAHLDVAYGLYSSLRTSVSSSPPTVGDTDLDPIDTPVDPTLTNSEIMILSQYAESQVASAPQYFTSSLWYWCYGNYNITTTVDSNGAEHIHRHNDILVCSKAGPRYPFSYIQVFSDVGLGAILAYAYQGNMFEEDKQNEAVKHQTSRFNMAISAVIFTVISQFVTFVLTLILYTNRKNRPDLKSCPRFLVNIAGLVSVASCVSCFVGVGIFTNVVVVVRHEVQKRLGSFGVSLHLGSVWFALCWCAAGFCLLCMISWAVPLWCDNPEDDIEDSVYREYNGFETYQDETPSRMSKWKNNVKRSKTFHRFSRHLSGYMAYDDEDDDNSMVYETYHDDDGDDGRMSKMKYFYHEDEKEHELRRLGESLSKKSSVRHTKLRPPTGDEFYDNKRSRVYQLFREETYNGYMGTNGLEEIKETSSQEYIPTRNLSNPNSRNNSTKKQASKKPIPQAVSPNMSILNDDEVNFLDQRNFIN